jgi:hypothetical protein
MFESEKKKLKFKTFYIVQNYFENILLLYEYITNLNINVMFYNICDNIGGCFLACVL